MPYQQWDLSFKIFFKIGLYFLQPLHGLQNGVTPVIKQL